MSGDERVTDPATIRNSWDADSERISQRVDAALQAPGRKAVVEVVMDETQELRESVAAARRGHTKAIGQRDEARAEVTFVRHMLDEVRAREQAWKGEAEQLRARLGQPRYCRACGQDVTVEP